MTPRSLISPLAVALATCAIAPAAALASPIIEGQGVAAGGGPGVTATQFKSQSLAAPDQVDRVKDKTANVYVPPVVTKAPAVAPAPTWPTGPQPVATRHAPVTAAPSDDDGGLDTGVWIALSGAALLALGGAGFAGQRLLVTRRRQQLA